MFNRLRKRLGYHVCERFTQWEPKKWITTDDRRYYITQHWQERKCLDCGLIQKTGAS